MANETLTWEEKLDPSLDGIEQKDIDFKPMLADHKKVDLDKVDYPIYASLKIDGCFNESAKVLTDKGYLRIKDIVDKKLKVKVLSFNHKKKCMEYKPVLQYFNNGKSKRGDWISILSNRKKFICTKNHKILTQNGYVRAENLDNAKHKVRNIMLSKDQISFIIGTLIGDGGLSVERRDKNTPIRLIMGCKHKEVINQKKKILNIPFTKDIKWISGYGTQMYGCVSNVLDDYLSFDLLDFITRMKDKSGKTYVTEKELSKKVTDIGVSVWIADDGSISYNNNNKKTPILYIHTQAYSEKQVNEFAKFFKKNYNVNPSIYREKRMEKLGYYLRFSTIDSFKILDRIKNNMYKKLEYKYQIKGTYQKSLNYDIKYSPFIKKHTYTNGNKYDLEVADNHNYVVGNTIVHNCRISTTPYGFKTRSKKNVQNLQTRQRFSPLLAYAKKHNVIIDGEAYDHNSTFQENSSYFKTINFADERSIKKHGKVLKLPETYKYYIFDVIPIDNPDMPFIDRLQLLEDIKKENFKYVEFVEQKIVRNKEEVGDYFNEALEKGYEGLILKKANGRYKYGRSTVKEGLMLKVKPFIESSTRITGVVQAKHIIECIEDMLQRLREDGNIDSYKSLDIGDEEVKRMYEKHYGELRKTNELGYSVTSKKKDDRVPIEMASGFTALYKGKEFIITIAEDQEYKKYIWQNRHAFIGKEVLYKAMEIGAKDVPRHCSSLRIFEEDE
jgi:hypothetical protein